jgi:hypothetical protein
MAFPPRPRSSRAEPSLSPAGAPARDAVPLRPAAPRAAARPGTGEAGAGRETVRFPAEHRRGAELQSISFDASDRLIVSSAIAGDSRKKRSFLRVLGFTVLLVLAAIGAYSLYHEASAFLP